MSARTHPLRNFDEFLGGEADPGTVGLTGSTRPASKSAATCDGAPPIDLIDGQKLSDLLKQFGLGVTLKERIEEDVTVELDFFDGV